MKKLTRKVYEGQMSNLVAEKAVTELNIARIIDNEIEAEYDGLNAKHDKVSELEQAIKDLEWQWSTRNWTGSDWNAYALIAQNID